MRLITTCFALALTVAAGAATASTAQARITDGQYLKLARCAGLAAGSGADAASMDALLRGARTGRAEYVREQARTNRSQSETDMRLASGATRERLTAELGACRA